MNVWDWVLPHVPTALSTPEGLPWMIFSPMNAHVLISSISSLLHLQHQQVKDLLTLILIE